MEFIVWKVFSEMRLKFSHALKTGVWIAQTEQYLYLFQLSPSKPLLIPSTPPPLLEESWRTRLAFSPNSWEGIRVMRQGLEGHKALNCLLIQPLNKFYNQFGGVLNVF